MVTGICDPSNLKHDTITESMLYFLESVLLNNDLNNRFDPHLLTEATGVRKQLRSLSFLVCFQTCKYLYGYTNSMSQQLQGSAF